MARPTDWNVLGLASDPTPGNPDRIDEVARSMVDLGQAARDVDTELEAVLNRTGPEAFTGAAADALREKINGRLRGFVQSMADSFAWSSAALTAYARELRDHQWRADNALAQARGLANGDPNLASLTSTAEQAQTARIESARAASTTLDNSASQIKQPLSGCEEFWELFKWIGIALVLPALLMGGPVALLAIAVNLTLFIKTAIDFAQGKASMLEFFLSALGILAPTTRAFPLFQLIAAGAKAIWGGLKAGALAVFNLGKGIVTGFLSHPFVLLPSLRDLAFLGGTWVKNGGLWLRGAITSFPTWAATTLSHGGLAIVNTVKGIPAALATIPPALGKFGRATVAFLSREFGGYKWLRIILPLEANEMGKGFGAILPALKLAVVDRGILGKFLYGKPFVHSVGSGLHAVPTPAAHLPNSTVDLSGFRALETRVGDLAVGHLSAPQLPAPAAGGLLVPAPQALRFDTSFGTALSFGRDSALRLDALLDQPLSALSNVHIGEWANHLPAPASGHPSFGVSALTHPSVHLGDMVHLGDAGSAQVTMASHLATAPVTGTAHVATAPPHMSTVAALDVLAGGPNPTAAHVLASGPDGLGGNAASQVTNHTTLATGAQHVSLDLGSTPGRAADALAHQVTVPPVAPVTHPAIPPPAGLASHVPDGAAARALLPEVTAKAVHVDANAALDLLHSPPPPAQVTGIGEHAGAALGKGVDNLADAVKVDRAFAGAPAAHTPQPVPLGTEKLGAKLLGTTGTHPPALRPVPGGHGGNLSITEAADRLPPYNGQAFDCVDRLRGLRRDLYGPPPRTVDDSVLTTMPERALADELGTHWQQVSHLAPVQDTVAAHPGSTAFVLSGEPGRPAHGFALHHQGDGKLVWVETQALPGERVLALDKVPGLPTDVRVIVVDHAGRPVPLAVDAHHLSTTNAVVDPATTVGHGARKTRSSAPPPVQQMAVRDALTVLGKYGELTGHWAPHYGDDLRSLEDRLTANGLTHINITPINLTHINAGDVHLKLVSAYHALPQTAERDSGIQLLNYIITGETAAPGLAGLSDLKMVNDGIGAALSGRPNFSRDLQSVLKVRPFEARRHITAWHNISAFLSKAYQSYGGRVVNLIDTVGGTSPRFKSDVQEIATGLVNLPVNHFGGINPPHAKSLMKGAYVANSKPENLWVGGSRENTQINGLSGNLQTLVKELRDGNADVQAWIGKLAGYQYNTALPQTVIADVTAKLDVLPQGETAWTNLADEIVTRYIKRLEVDVKPGTVSGLVDNMVYRYTFVNPTAIPTFPEVATVVQYFLT